MKHNKIFIVGYALFFMSVMYARVHVMTSVHQFNKQRTQSHLLVVLFYKDDKRTSKDSPSRMNNDELLKMYNYVSDKRFYDDADISFVRINVADNMFDEVLQQYTIKQLPSFIVFDNGRVTVDEHGNVAILTGFVTNKVLHAFIKKYGGKKIEMLLERKENARKKRLIEEREESKPYFYPPADMTYEGTYWTRPLHYSVE